MIPIALLKEFGCLHHERAPRDIAIKELKINNIKIKIIPFVIDFVEAVSFGMDKFNSK